jgi:hypothetical protein
MRDLWFAMRFASLSLQALGPATPQADFLALAFSLTLEVRGL